MSSLASTPKCSYEQGSRFIKRGALIESVLYGVVLFTSFTPSIILRQLQDALTVVAIFQEVPSNCMGDTIRLIGRGQFSSCSDVGEVLEGKPSHSGYFSQGFFESWTEGEGEPK